MDSIRRFRGPLQLCVLCYFAATAINVAVHYPYATDRQKTVNPDKAAADFYRLAYAPPTKEEQELEDKYVQLGRREAQAFGVEDTVKQFVAEHALQDKRVLDIGAGRGYLQDMVRDYVGLDISPTAARYFHKPFVLASATAMPFHDNEFDAAWTIWVLEHVPNPENALVEMRRVVKPGGVILLMPAWFCTSWAAEGYQVRPYRDFGVSGKIVKASLLVRDVPAFQASYILPYRALRLLAWKVDPGPTTFHYKRLQPNYKKYWQPDSDAVNSMDPYEALVWFESRGDRCLNCAGGIKDIMLTPEPLIIQVSAKK